MLSYTCTGLEMTRVSAMARRELVAMVGAIQAALYQRLGNSFRGVPQLRAFLKDR
jgi:hypothetical protein